MFRHWVCSKCSNRTAVDSPYRSIYQIMKEWRIIMSQDRYIRDMMKAGAELEEAYAELLKSKTEGIEEESLADIARTDNDIIIINRNCPFCEKFEIKYDVMMSEWSCSACGKNWQAVKLHRKKV